MGFCQTLWPGDVNNNGIVNGVDILYIGQVWHLEGPVRANQNTSWQGTNYTPWEGAFANGANHALADCNGNGEVDEDDIEQAVLPNWGLTHGDITDDIYNNGVEGEDIVMRLEPVDELVYGGDAVEIVLELGTETNPVSDFNGISMKLNFDAEFIADVVDFDFVLDENTWLDDNPTDSLKVYLEKNIDTGEADLTIIKRRNIFQTSAGFGKVGTFYIIVEDIVVGDALDTFNIKVENVLMVDDGFNSSPVVTDESGVAVAGPEFLVSNKDMTSDLAKDIKISPNPANDYLSIQVPDYADIETISLMNIVGQEFQLSNYKRGGHFTINLEAYPAGIYYLSLKTPTQIITRVVLIN